MAKLKQRPKILIVDDKPENLYTLEKLLAKLEVEVMQTTSGFEALELTLTNEFCLAIVDVQMSEMDGYELVELLRGKAATLLKNKYFPYSRPPSTYSILRNGT